MYVNPVLSKRLTQYFVVAKKTCSLRQFSSEFTRDARTTLMSHGSGGRDLEPA